MTWARSFVCCTSKVIIIKLCYIFSEMFQSIIVVFSKCNSIIQHLIRIHWPLNLLKPERQINFSRINPDLDIAGHPCKTITFRGLWYYFFQLSLYAVPGTTVMTVTRILLTSLAPSAHGEFNMILLDLNVNRALETIFG